MNHRFFLYGHADIVFLFYVAPSYDNRKYRVIYLPIIKRIIIE